jgi:SAM-dependent methyltransferase
VGCGQGRFFEFLQQYVNDFQYTGVDFSEKLLELARAEYGKYQNCQFQNVDVTQENWMQELPKTKYDLITMFGVWHHLPGEVPQQLLKQTYQRVQSGGMLVFTTWNFMEAERLRRKIVDEKGKVEEENQDLELSTNEFWMSWKKGREAVRYVRQYGDSEVQSWIEESGWQLVTSFREDGKERRVNTYWVLRKSR